MAKTKLPPPGPSKTSLTAASRKKMAGTGAAMAGGGFPIKNAQDLRNAISDLGRANDKAAAKAHIISRARALGLTAALPPNWLITK